MRLKFTSTITTLTTMTITIAITVTTAIPDCLTRTTTIGQRATFSNSLLTTVYFKCICRFARQPFAGEKQKWVKEQLRKIYHLMLRGKSSDPFVLLS